MIPDVSTFVLNCGFKTFTGHWYSSLSSLEIDPLKCMIQQVSMKFPNGRKSKIQGQFNKTSD